MCGQARLCADAVDDRTHCEPCNRAALCVLPLEAGAASGRQRFSAGLGFTPRGHAGVTGPA